MGPEEDKIELRSEEFQEILGSVPPWVLRWGITVLAAVVAILLVGSAVVRYPDVLSAQVTVTGSTPPATLVSRASGKLKELYVEDNQEVKTGDYLAVIENPAKTEDIRLMKNCLDSFNLSENRIASLRLTLGALQSLYSSFCNALFEYNEYKRLSYYPQKIENAKERIAQYEEQYRNLLDQQKIIIEQSELAQKLHQRDSTAQANGAIPDKEFELSKSQYLSSKLSLITMQSAVGNMEIQIAQLRESLFEIGHQDTEKLNSLQSQLNAYVSQLKTEIMNWEQNYALIAPIDGKITFTKYWVVNQNVQAGTEVFTIVSENNETIVKALLPVARSGKVAVGQRVNIRIDNFPENEYGILKGRVENISLVPAQSNQTLNYTVEISLPEGLVTTYNKELPFLSEMYGQADIVTEDLSLLERLILPLKKILKESL